MWHSIQSRSPFFCRPYFEYVAQLPLDTRLRNGWAKYIFRLAMKGILPESVRLRRTKVGFEIPERKWIETELRTEIQTFFSKANPGTAKYYNSKAARGLLDVDRLTDYETKLIWRILNLEVWYREFFGEVKASGGGKRSATFF
jgi:asparagine synthase (glutamine-hydrolysing)